MNSKHKNTNLEGSLHSNPGLNVGFKDFWYKKISINSIHKTKSESKMSFILFVDYV